MLLPCYCHDVAMLLPCYSSRPYPSHPVSHLDMKAITHQGSEPELRQYIKDHLDIGVYPDIEVVLDVLSQLGLAPLVCDGFHVQVGHWV